MIRALFVGLGSIGQRHFRNLAEILSTQGKEFRIDAVRGTSHQLPEDIENTIGRQYSSRKDVSEEYDLLFITNPTLLHYETLRQLGNKAPRIFIEKPVFHDSSLDLGPLALESQKNILCSVSFALFKNCAILAEIFDRAESVWCPGNVFQLFARMETGAGLSQNV